MLEAIRLVLVGALLGGLSWVALRPRQVGSIVSHFLFAEKGALNLGLFRILVFGSLCFRAESADMAALVSLPEVLRAPPQGWVWLSEIIPLFDPDLAGWLRAVTVSTAAFATLGLGTRFMAPIATLGAVYVLGLPNFFNKINHGQHALIWCATLLSASRCERALSLDAFVATFRQKAPRLSLPYDRSVANGLPIRVCWLLFGVAYFFPGLFKAWNAGDLWLSGEAVRGVLLAALTRSDFAPPFPLQEYSLLTVVAGVGTLLFELGFVFILFSKRFWWVAPAMGAIFHVSVLEFMGISFMAMLKLYYWFFDFEWALEKLGKRLPTTLRQHLALPRSTETGETPESKRPRPASTALAPLAVVGGFLLLANLYTGYAKVNSWPFSHFPLFAGRVEDDTPNLRRLFVKVKSSKEEKWRKVEQRKLRGAIRSGRWRTLLKTVARERDRRERAELLDAVMHVVRKAGYNVGRGGEVAIIQETLSIDEETGERLVVAKKPVLQETL